VLTIAPYCEEESQKAGATDAQIKAGIALVERAMADLSGIDVEIVAITAGTEFRAWHRLKAPKMDCRAIVEIIRSTMVVLHVVLPKNLSTYYNVEELWVQHRQIGS
jgi:hypothetical protein